MRKNYIVCNCTSCKSGLIRVSDWIKINEYEEERICACDRCGAMLIPTEKRLINKK